MQSNPLTPPRPVTPHSILVQKLRALTQQAEILSGIDSSFKQALNTAAQLAAGLKPYIGRFTTPESPALSTLTQRTQSEDWSWRFNTGETAGSLEQEMLSGHTEGQFLKSLLHGLQAKRVLEIGLFTGYSALAMAEELPEDGVLIACELDAYVAGFAEGCFANSPRGHKIQIKVGPAIDTLKQLADAGESFDFVFIDANKDGYFEYLDVLLKRSMLSSNALVCVDNTLMQGQPYLSNGATANGRAIAQFNQSVAEDTRVQQVILPIRDGVTLIRRS